MYLNLYIFIVIYNFINKNMDNKFKEKILILN